MKSPQRPQESTEIGTLIKASEAEIVELKSLCKGMRRRAADSASVSFPSSSALKFTEMCRELTPLVKALHLFGRTAAQQAGLQGEASLPTTKLAELLLSAIDKGSLMSCNRTGPGDLSTGRTLTPWF